MKHSIKNKILWNITHNEILIGEILELQNMIEVSKRDKIESCMQEVMYTRHTQCSNQSSKTIVMKIISNSKQIRQTTS